MGRYLTIRTGRQTKAQLTVKRSGLIMFRNKLCRDLGLRNGDSVSMLWDDVENQLWVWKSSDEDSVRVWGREGQLHAHSVGLASFLFKLCPWAEETLRLRSGEKRYLEVIDAEAVAIVTRPMGMLMGREVMKEFTDK